MASTGHHDDARGDNANGAGAPVGPIARFGAWLLLLLVGVVWGLTFSLAKIAVGGGAHPLGVAFWQAFLGAGLLIAVMAARRRAVSFKPEMVKLYVICGLLGTIIPSILFYHAARYVSAGVLSITVAVVPILTFALAALFGAERFTRRRVMGVICGALSVLLLVVPAESLPDPSVVPWVLAAFVAAACYAGENLIIALRMPAGASPLMIVCGMLLFATAVLAPIVFAAGGFVPLVWPWGPVEWAIVGMAVINVGAYSLFIFLIDRAGPVFASQAAYVVTLAGVAWGIAIFDERHSVWIWVSLAVMIVGLALVTPRKKTTS